MEPRLVPALLALLVAARATLGQVNLTDSTNTTVHSCLDPSDPTLNCSLPVTSPPAPVPPLWCPAGYRLMRTQGKWVHACQPLSCSGSNATRMCARMTPGLQGCPKASLAPHQHRFEADGTLTDLLHGLEWPLGDYVVDAGRVIVCDPAWNESLPDPLGGVELPRWCMPIAVARGGHRTTAAGLYVGALGQAVRLFEVEGDGTAHACPEIDPGVYETCPEVGVLPGDEIEVLPNWDIQDHKNILVRAVFPRGEHILAVDRSFALICIVAAEPLSEGATLAYGAASIFSAVCLLLALLAHLFFPTLNYHAKALLCFAFSLFVMYIAMAVRSFCGNFEAPAANLTLFAVQYIFGLAAFFWLSILAFDLWRVFANLRGTITPGNTTGKKRVFFAKCVYAWGIPTVLCIVVIALTFSPNVQKSLKLDLDLQSTNWILDTTTLLIIFYTPISIVLIENVIFFILTIINLRKASSGTDILNKKMNRKLFRVYMKLFLVMGLCWFAEIISWFLINNTTEAVWYVTDIINCLQGAFIFLIYVCKKKTLLIIKNKLGKISVSQMNSSTSSTQDRDRKISAISMEAMQKRAAMGTTVNVKRVQLSESAVSPHATSYFMMDVRINISSTVLLLIVASVMCDKDDQRNISMNCSHHDASDIKCSLKKKNLEKYFSSSSVKPSFWCPDGYHLTNSAGTWLHACRPKSCPGRALPNPVECQPFTTALKMCPKLYLEVDQYRIDDHGNLDDLHHSSSVPLGNYFIESTRAIICDPKRNLKDLKPHNWTELPGWCMSFEVPQGGFIERGDRLFVKEFNLDVERFSLENGDTALVCTDISLKIYETCGNDTGFLPGDEIEILHNWTIRDTMPVLDKYIYHLGEYILTENMSMAIVCTTVEETDFGKASVIEVSAASLFSAFILVLEFLI